MKKGDSNLREASPASVFVLPSHWHLVAVKPGLCSGTYFVLDQKRAGFHRASGWVSDCVHIMHRTRRSTSTQWIAGNQEAKGANMLAESSGPCTFLRIVSLAKFVLQFVLKAHPYL